MTIARGLVCDFSRALSHKDGKVVVLAVPQESQNLNSLRSDRPTFPCDKTVADRSTSDPDIAALVGMDLQWESVPSIADST